MVKQNRAFKNLSPNYLFPEIQQRVWEFKQKNPNANIISLGIGDTSEPIPKNIAKALSQKALSLATPQNYEGYGPEQGNPLLRQEISKKVYQEMVLPEEIYISDGAKCDIGRLQMLFGSDVSLAVQDPTYPVYVDSSAFLYQKKISFLPCTPENGFFPNWENSDLVFFCSPNNPTGVAATRKELELLVARAKENHSIIIYDAAYSSFITNDAYPRSIYEIEGAKEVAIEVSSFSKIVGFTGVRLGWSVVPNALKYEDGSEVQTDWKRVITTLFNGASNIAQAGGIEALSDEGQKHMNGLLNHYRQNTSLLKEALTTFKRPIYGGEHSPYLWVDFRNQDSWTTFDTLLQKAHCITTPGVGFGQSGQGFIRFSAFGKRDHILEACNRLKIV